MFTHKDSMKIPLSSYSNYVEITNTLRCLYEMFIKSAGGTACEQAVPGLWGLGVCYDSSKLSTRYDS